MEISDPDFERKLKAQLVNLEPWAPRRPKLPLPELILLDVLQLLLAGPWRNLAIRCYIHPTSPTTAWEISPEGDYASVALTKRTLLISGKCGDPWHRVDWRLGWRTKGWEEPAMRLLRPLRPVDKPGNPMTPPNPVTPGRNAS